MSSASKSYLSSTKYNFDVAVAVTQAGFNEALAEYLLSFPGVTQYFVLDPQGNPVEITLEQLNQKSGNVDPWLIPDGTAESDSRVQALANALFTCAISTTPGNPPMLENVNWPDIVEFKGNTQNSNEVSVNMNLLYYKFQFCIIGAPTYANRTLNYDTKQGWYLSIPALMQSSTVEANDYASLPANVQSKINELDSESFQVQQLVFVQQPGPPRVVIVWPDGEGNLSSALGAVSQLAVTQYLNQLKEQPEFCLGANIVFPKTDNNALDDPSSPVLDLTSYGFSITPYLDDSGNPVSSPTPDQAESCTLSYLCMANGKSLPTRNPFTWNWVDSSQIKVSHGAASINRNALIGYFLDQLRTYVGDNCFQPTLSGDSVSNVDISFAAGQSPTISMPGIGTGDTVLSFDWTSENSTVSVLWINLGGNKVWINCSAKSSYSLAVEFLNVQAQGTIIRVTQTRQLWVQGGQFSVSGYYYDTTIVETFTLGIASDGTLVPKSTIVPVDNANAFVVANFASGTGFANSVQSAYNTPQSIGLTSTPLSIVQNLVFPGGKTFFFTNVFFSDNQDLVANFSYQSQQ